MPRTCAACQQANPDDSSFCQYCGAALPAAAPAGTAAAEAAEPEAAASAGQATTRRRAPRRTAASKAPAPTEEAATAAAGAGGGAETAQAAPPAPDAEATETAPAPVPPAVPVAAAAAGAGVAGAAGAGLLNAVHRRLGTAGMAAVAGGSLGAVIVVGLVVPKLIGPSPHPVPAPVVPSNNNGPVSPPTTSPPTTSPPTTTPPTTTPSTTPETTPSTIPSSPSGPIPSSTGGQTFSNSAVSVGAPAGWSQDSSSTDSDLVLNGPDDLVAEFAETDSLQSSVTTNDIIQQNLQNWQKQFPDANICEQPSRATIPGGLIGVNVSFCFTPSSQGGQATPIQDVAGLSLLSNSNGSESLLEADLYVPQGLSDSQLKADLGSMVQNVKWLKVRS